MEKSDDTQAGYAFIKRIPKAVWISLSFGLLYLLSLSHNLSVAHDSITYFAGLYQEPGFGSGHHLLHHSFSWFWLRLGLSLGFSSPLLIASSLNAIAGGIMLGILFSFLRKRLKLPTSSSLGAVMVAGFSYGIWAYSTVLEVYMLPLCLMIGSWWFLTGEGPHDWIWALLLHILATLFHQMHLLALPLAVFYLFQRNSAWFRYGLHWGLGVGLSYLLFMWSVMDYREWSQMWNFITGLTQDEHFWGMGGPPGVLVGNARAWLGGHFMFRFSAEQLPLVNSLATTDDAFLVRNLPSWGAWLCLFTAAIAGLLILWSMIRGLYQVILYRGSERSLLSLILGGIVLYSLFFMFWVPINPEFWLFQLLLWTMIFARLWKQKPFYLFLLAACLGISNFTGSIYWLQSEEHDLYYQKAMFWQKNSQKGDLILVESGWPQLDFATHFTENPLLVWEECGTDSVRRTIARHNRLLLETSLIPILELDSLQWQRQKVPCSLGPYEYWQRH